MTPFTMLQELFFISYSKKERRGRDTMSKEEMRAIIEKRLAEASMEDKNRIIALYEDLYETALAKGKGEEEIMKELGLREMVVPKRSPSLAQKIGIGIGLVLFNVMVALVPAIMLVSIYLSLWTVAVAFIIGGATLLISPFFIRDMDIIQSIFISMIMSGLGVLLAVALIFIGKLLYRGARFYFGFHMKMMRGE